MTETVLVACHLFKELYEHISSIEEILATLEGLANKEGFERMEKGLEEYRKSMWLRRVLIRSERF